MATQKRKRNQGHHKESIGHVTAMYEGLFGAAVVPVTPAEQAAANGGGSAPGSQVKLKVRGPGIGIEGIREHLRAQGKKVYGDE